MSKQRVVVVTGGGSGMGRVTAHKFADAGDKVYIIGRRIEMLQETAEGHANIEYLQADVTDFQSIQKVRDTILATHKSIDVLVNNAGGTLPIGEKPAFGEITRVWEQIIATNLTSVFYVTLAFQEYMSRPGGRIINITSIAAIAGSSIAGVTGQAYSAAKAGVHGLSRALMRPLANEGVTINCIAPGVIDNTEFFGGDGVPQDRKDRVLPGIPRGRLGKPEEVAAGVFYLASEEADFVTGEILNINGGAQFGR